MRHEYGIDYAWAGGASEKVCDDTILFISQANIQDIEENKFLQEGKDISCHAWRVYQLDMIHVYG